MQEHGHGTDELKDYFKESRSKWINIFPNNPTQTDILRFKRMPQGEENTAFSRGRNEFKKKRDLYKGMFDSIREDFRYD